MSTLHPGLLIKVCWFDDDMIELAISASNGQFAGRTSFYARLDEPGRLAACISGFPRSQSDSREYEFGGTLSGYGGAKIRFSCKDAKGHLLVQVSIYAAPGDQKDFVQSAVIQINVVPASIDSFVRDLNSMKLKVGEEAMLKNET
jgi:hypothetical protein